jgi:hypothetical protein
MRRERLKLRTSSGRHEALHLEIRFVAPSLEANVRLTPLRDILVDPRPSAAWWQSGFKKPVIYRLRTTLAPEPPRLRGGHHFDASLTIPQIATKLLNTTRKHQNILHMLPATMGRLPNITKADFTKGGAPCSYSEGPRHSC